MPVATSWSAASRMSLSLTRSAKKFQLFQPMGGVCATTFCGACDVLGGACDAAVREVRTKTAEESKATMRMVAFLKTISGQVVLRLDRARGLVARQAVVGDKNVTDDRHNKRVLNSNFVGQ